jgi:hypothetical protein
MASEVHIIRVPPKSDGRDHHWTCPKAAPLLRTGDCNCGASEPASDEGRER